MYPIYRYDIEQNTEEWENIKIGMFSASAADKLLSSKDTKGYQQLISKIAEERITGLKCESSSFMGNSFTNRGHEYESIARHDYEFRTLQAVKLIGVIIKDEWTLCSPDGLIDDNKHHQIKCPIFSTQEEYLEKASKYTDIRKIIPSNYYKQLQFELNVSGRDINIFTSYHPNLKAIDIEVPIDVEMQIEINKRLKEAKEEVLSRIEKIKRLQI